MGYNKWYSIWYVRDTDRVYHIRWQSNYVMKHHAVSCTPCVQNTTSTITWCTKHDHVSDMIRSSTHHVTAVTWSWLDNTDTTSGVWCMSGLFYGWQLIATPGITPHVVSTITGEAYVKESHMCLQHISGKTYDEVTANLCTPATLRDTLVKGMVYTLHVLYTSNTR